jgi:hypothetical protein
VHNGDHSTVIRWWRLQQLLIQQPLELGVRPDLPVSGVRLACEAWLSTANTSQQAFGDRLPQQKKGQQSCSLFSSRPMGLARWDFNLNQFRGGGAKTIPRLQRCVLNPRRRMFF